MKPINIILDTDIGNDCDDIMALALLLWGQKNGLCKLSAITYSQTSPHAVSVINSVYRYHDETPPPIGLMPFDEEVRDYYCKFVADKFAISEDYEVECETAVRVFRKALALNEEKSVICAVGPFTNVAALLNSEPDDISTLNGVELVKEKCSKMVVMCGSGFERADMHYPEWNALVDPVATKTVMAKCPVDMVILPAEVGSEMLTGKALVEKYEDSTPLTRSFLAYEDARRGRPSWDPATVLYVLEGCMDRFIESDIGFVCVTDKGATYHYKNEFGHCRYLKLNLLEGETEDDAKRRIAKIMDDRVTSIMY